MIDDITSMLNHGRFSTKDKIKHVHLYLEGEPFMSTVSEFPDETHRHIYWPTSNVRGHAAHYVYVHEEGKVTKYDENFLNKLL